MSPSQPAHTPTPWEVDSRKQDASDFTDYVIYPSKVDGMPWRDEAILVDTFNADCIYSPEDRKAYCAHIVRCVNAHAALVEACQAAKTLLESWGYSSGNSGVIRDCDAALALAKPTPKEA